MNFVTNFQEKNEFTSLSGLLSCPEHRLPCVFQSGAVWSPVLWRTEGGNSGREGDGQRAWLELWGSEVAAADVSTGQYLPGAALPVWLQVGPAVLLGLGSPGCLSALLLGCNVLLAVLGFLAVLLFLEAAQRLPCVAGLAEHRRRLLQGGDASSAAVC